MAYACDAVMLRTSWPRGQNFVERLCSDLDRKEPRYKCATLLLLCATFLSSDLASKNCPWSRPRAFVLEHVLELFILASWKWV